MNSEFADAKDSRSTMNRRRMLATTGTVLSSAMVSGSAIAGSPNRRVSETIPARVARKAVQLKLSQVAGSGQFVVWADAAIGSPAPFYMRAPRSVSKKYIRSAYVFPVVKNGDEVGYITAGAHRSMEPILEYCTDTSPTKKVTKAKIAAKQGSVTPGRRIYTGGISYGLEVDDQQVLNVQDGSIAYLGRGSPNELGFTSARSEERWELVTAGTYGTDRTHTDQDVTPMDKHVLGVPSWTESDTGTASNTTIGLGSDSWNDWDGCTPIAASMVIGYHEGIGEGQHSTRESIIDRLHIKMESNANGSTLPLILNLDGDVN